MTEMLVFMLGAGTLVTCSLAVVFAKNPLRSALALICALCASAVLYVMLDASFIAAMQVLVYAGAIMVLIVFVVMLLDLGTQQERSPPQFGLIKLLGVGSIAYVGYRMVSAMQALMLGSGVAVDGSVKHIGILLLTDYLFGFEAISVMLLVAVVGAVVLGRKRLT